MGLRAARIDGSSCVDLNRVGDHGQCGPWYLTSWGALEMASDPLEGILVALVAGLSLELSSKLQTEPHRDFWSLR